MYRESASAMKGRCSQDEPRPGQWLKLAGNAALFTGIPILVITGLHWVVYAFTADSVYRDAWMMPTLFLFSGFVSGVLIRQRMETCSGKMGLFLVGILSLIAFGYLTYRDIHTFGGIYSHWLPHPLSYALQDYIWLLPGVGIVGMLFHHFFMLRNEG